MTGPAPAVIDLGRDRAEPELSRPWRQTTLGAVPLRVWLAALLVVVLLSPLAGSAGPDTGLVRLWSQSGVAAFELDAERLYAVVDHHLTAYQVDDGAVGWTAVLPAAARSSAYTVHPAGSVILVRGDMPDTGAVAVVAYDAATGQPRWELVGDWGWPWLQDGLIVFTRGDTDAPAGSSGRVAEIAVADAASGATPWVGRFGGGELLHVAPAADGPQAVAWGDDNVMRRVDLVTGAELARTDVHYRPNAWWFTAAGTLIVGDRHGMTAFDLETLESRWSAQPEIVDDEATRYVTARGGHPCAPWVCVEDSAGAIRVLDPTTGQSRWEKRCAGGPDDCFLVLLPFADGLAWMETYRLPTPTGRPQLTVSLLDQATGAEVARLGPWQTLYATGGPSRLVRLADGVIAGVGYQREDELTQRDILGWLGRDGRVRVLGQIEAGWLTTNGSHVVAATGQQIDVMRVRTRGGG